ncbi:hypothetical protein PGT21_005324 [Puccinia graminis f. sp. tritici]|uniref:Expansin-like EG45 domain-containing protein n=1 Tax=Puccinia graminis f. sp. tritici TaxID=56615 RepID=A0A5B0LJS4_PUCGR|nr:hypothetical protein PGT21_005324 [Puccinia graminis f. sp. tritici]
MVYNAPRIRIPMALLLFCFSLNLIQLTSASSSGAAHHQAGTAKSKIKRSSCASRKKPNGPALTQTYSGKGTRNPTAGGGGNCAFTKWPVPKGYGPLAIATNQWNSAKACGACIEVEGPGGKFMGIVNDQCPSCEPNGLDLDSNLWNQVSGNKPPGIIQIKWKIVPCGFSKPVMFMNKTGVSKDWNSIQVQGANTPLKSLEVSTDGGSSWTPLEVQSNSNYYQPKNGKGLGTTGDIRVTCLSGKQFVTKNIELATPESPKAGSGNC